MRKMLTSLFSLLLGIFTVATPHLLAQQFQSPSAYSVGPNAALPMRVTTADFNNDGNLDLAVGVNNGHTLAILLGIGNGTFTLPRPISTGNTIPVSVAAGDLNGDGNLDLVALRAAGNAPGNLSVYLGNGDGTFTEGSGYQLHPSPADVVLADFDGDGKLDAAVTQGIDGLVVAFGNGDGTFGRVTSYTISGYANHIVSADLNGDGHPDLALSIAGTQVAVLLNQGDGSFVSTAYSAGGETSGIVLADFNKDSKLDIAVADIQGGGVWILLGNGDGSFGPASFNAISGIAQYPQSLVAQDFDLDGNLDLAVVGEYKDAALLYGNGDGTFQGPASINTLVLGAWWVVSGDFDKNGAPDLAMSLYDIRHDYSRVAVLLNVQ